MYSSVMTGTIDTYFACRLPVTSRHRARPPNIQLSIMVRVVLFAMLLLPYRVIWCRCNRDGKASMLFTVRTSKVSTHKGQVLQCMSIHSVDVSVAAIYSGRDEISFLRDAKVNIATRASILCEVQAYLKWKILPKR